MGVARLRVPDEDDTVDALAPELRRRRVEAIVVLLHRSGFQNGGGNASDIKGCLGAWKSPAGSDSDVRKIVARRYNAVELVIRSYTHPAHRCSAKMVEAVAVGGAATAKTRSPGPPQRCAERPSNCRSAPMTNTLLVCR